MINDIDALKKELRERIDLLPQRDAIENDDMNQWIDYVANVMPKEALWHATRASGVGGSEIGGLVKNYLGHRADFMFSAHNWAQDKLLRRHPEPSGGALRRGIEMEDVHRQRFHETYGATRDIDAFRALGASHSKGREYLRYSPDDIIDFKTPTVIDVGERQIEVQGRILIDYKCPTTVNTDGASFQYACQLHQGALIAEENGIELSGTLLSQWDLTNWTIYNDLVAINPELQELIKKASDYYWNSVLNGDVPNYIHAQRYSLDEEVKSEWSQAVERFSMVNALKTQLDNEAKGLRSIIEEGLALGSERLDSQQVVFDGVLKISASSRMDEEKIRNALPKEAVEAIEVKNKTTSYDTAALVRYVKEQGIDVKPFRIANKIDPEKAYNALAEYGLNPEEYISESRRFLVDKAISTKAKIWVQENFPEIETPEPRPLSLQATENSAAAQDRAIEVSDSAPSSPRLSV